jgi:hypothetical protein
MTTKNARSESVSPVDSIHDINLYIVWKSLADVHKRALAEFWLRNKAVPTPAEALRRADEAVCIALDPTGRIAGVTTVYIAPYGDDKLPYWHYRTFVRPDCRLPGLTVRFFRASLKHLKEVASSQPIQPRGLVVFTENRRLKHQGWHKKFIREGMHFIGTTPDGMHIWRHDFKSDNN